MNAPIWRLTSIIVLFLFCRIDVRGFAAEPSASLESVKSALASTQIYRGPDESKVKRSAWGPDLYRSTVNGAVLIMVFDINAGEEPKLLGQGSGAVLTTSGLVITNWHVTWPHNLVVVVSYPGPLRTYADLTEDDMWLGQVVRVSQRQDLALLQIKAKPKGPSTSSLRLRPLPLEEPGSIEVGQDVYAIGHPEGLHWTYTEGVISQIRPHYHWKIEDTEFVATTIQTQTTVSYGSSGGPLLNRNGRLVGIISNGIPTRPGLNFAVSAHEIRQFLAN